MVERYVLDSQIHFSDNSLKVVHKIFNSKEDALHYARILMLNYAMCITSLKIFNLYTSEVVYHV